MYTLLNNPLADRYRIFNYYIIENSYEIDNKINEFGHIHIKLDENNQLWEFYDNDELYHAIFIGYEAWIEYKNDHILINDSLGNEFILR